MNHPQIKDLAGACPFCNNLAPGEGHQPDGCVFCKNSELEALFELIRFVLSVEHELRQAFAALDRAREGR